jgi:hypothetical protein
MHGAMAAAPSAAVPVLRKVRRVVMSEGGRALAAQ